MTGPSREQIREQIRRDGRQAGLGCPEPTVEQMRQVGDVLLPAIARIRGEKRGAA